MAGCRNGSPDEKGYFTAEGLEYSFVLTGDYGVHLAGRDQGGEIRTGAFETFRRDVTART